jgi:hypothetical protein
MNSALVISAVNHSYGTKVAISWTSGKQTMKLALTVYLKQSDVPVVAIYINQTLLIQMDYVLHAQIINLTIDF